MRKPTTSAALALILALTLAGCSSNEDESPTDAGSASAMVADPTAGESAMEKDDESMEKDDSMESEDAMEKDDSTDAMATEGAWIDQAAYEADPDAYHSAGDVVLFFNATWCPTCQAAVESLDTDGTPAGLTVVSVDYDTATGLRQEYGVTVQHTFVQVDGSGAELAKFTGSTSGAEIAANTV